jgi:predicted RNA-binding Zn-ribbon protein involved in translation (DUF1610 family)
MSAVLDWNSQESRDLFVRTYTHHCVRCGGRVEIKEEETLVLRCMECPRTGYMHRDECHRDKIAWACEECWEKK